MSGPTVDIITPPPGTAYAGMTGEAFDVLARLFARHGISAWARDWTDAGLGTADATLPLLAWGYHLDPVGWDALLDRWPADARLMNSARLLRWNGRKTYLSELAAAGVPIVPTHFVPLADETALAGAFADFGGSEIVVKPQVSAGSHDTFRLHRGDPPPRTRDAMIQPFLSAVAGEGELAVFLIGGQLSHGGVKRAAAGDFRVQPQFGGRIDAWQPDAEALAVACAAVAALPEAPFYVRVDLIRLPEGRLAVMEVEAIEPDLYLHLAPDGGDMLALALRDAIALAQ